MAFKILAFFSLLLFWAVGNSSAIPQVSHQSVFWHVTDIHVDQNYSRTGNPLDLCHDDNTDHPDNGLYGNFLCDSPLYLVNATINSMKIIEPHPDFVLWTGDNLPHTSGENPEWNLIFEAIKNVTELLKVSFPGIPVFPSIGNHDTFPPNMLIPNSTTDTVYKNFLEKGGWEDFLDENAKSTFIKGGYYSQIIRPALRIISLNTILWYEPNTFTEGLIDPVDQFQWFEDVLKNSSTSHEKVYIIGHVPPGYYNRVRYPEQSKPTYHPQYLATYLQLLKRYADIIIGQLFGHLHIDMFQLFQCDSGVFLSSSLLASSVTPWYHDSGDNSSVPVNPSVRLMYYSHQDGQLKDYDQFFLNLTKLNSINKTEESTSVYELLYKFTDFYKVPDLSTNSLVNVYEKLKENPDLYEAFYKFSTAGKETYPCDSHCKTAQMCSIACSSHDEYYYCMTNVNASVYVCNNAASSPTNYYIILYVGIALVFTLVIFLGFYFWYGRNRHVRYEQFSSF
ncbi:acid sphingomyelinase-like phosphodiesterase 3b [Uloborus diversus]|uniref:acid sphingomyelinase-like phosphodiesterase 3b n=1 Tax=Uloborus diversus TaxID=327109 RepID=UPI00240A80C3|nr:acid sphingomyelinase-like phosphodiesterase 3b [Uloborus diversus]